MPRTPWEITTDMFLSVPEVEQLLAFVRHRADRDAAALLDQVIVESLLFSGLRCSEFCRLELRDVHLSGSDANFTVRGPGRERRTVYLPNSLGKLIRAYIRGTRSTFLPDEVKPADTSKSLIFNEHRRPFERTGLYRRVVRILTEAGLGERASVQLLRHTYGYLAYLRTGGNLLFVQRQLGHAHPMITSVYARFVEQSYTDLAERVAECAPTQSQSRATMSRKMKGIPHGVH